MSTGTPTVLIAAGGTGGHVFPARALAEELVGRGAKVIFITDGRGIGYLESLEHVEIHRVTAGPYRGGLSGRVLFAVSLLRGFLQSRALIKRDRPDIAVGFGGYPSAPPLFAAQFRRVPTILHEQNAVLGLANKLLAPLAEKIALSFPLKENCKGRDKTVLTGNPVRRPIMDLREKPFPQNADAVDLLIFGGSLGAVSFARIVPHAVIRAAKALSIPLNITHQVRTEDIDEVRRVYDAAGLTVELKSFFSDIAERIAQAQLLICRAGASTVAELSCAGRPAIYIPYPWHKDQQQLHNAQTVTSRGGGWVIEEKDLTIESMAAQLITILGDADALRRAADAAKAAGQADAVGRLADEVLATAGQ